MSSRLRETVTTGRGLRYRPSVVSYSVGSTARPTSWCPTSHSQGRRGTWSSSSTTTHATTRRLCGSGRSESSRAIAQAPRAPPSRGGSSPGWEEVRSGQVKSGQVRSGQVRSGQVRFITRPKSRTMRATRQLMLPPTRDSEHLRTHRLLKSTSSYARMVT